MGYVGVSDSVLGIDKHVIIKRMTSYYPQKHIYPDGDIMINAAVISVDEKTGKCTGIERLYII